MDEQTEEFMTRLGNLTMAAADLKLYDVAAILSFLQCILIGARNNKDYNYLEELVDITTDIATRSLDDHS